MLLFVDSDEDTTVTRSDANHNAPSTAPARTGELRLNPRSTPVHHTFTSATSQVSHLAETLGAVANICSQALLIISPTGITIYGEYNHIVNVQLTLDPSLFRVYNFYTPQNDSQLVADMEYDSADPDDHELRLCVNIDAIAETFASVLGSLPPNTKKSDSGNSDGKSLVDGSNGVVCYISYNGEGHPLVVEFEDSLLTERVEFFTFYSEMYYPYADIDEDNDDAELPYRLVVDHNKVQYEIIVKSDVLYNILQDLDKINTEELFVFISNERRKLGYRDPLNQQPLLPESNISFIDNQLNFISKGPIGFLKLLYPNDRTVLEKLIIYEQHDVVAMDGLMSVRELKKVNSSLITSYKFDTFIKVLPAVRLSSKCKIMKDFNGILSVQLLCKNPKLPNYSGSLITFNMLELATMDNNTDYTPNISYITLNNIFDDDLYQYVKGYRADGKETIEYNVDLDEHQSGGAIELPLFI